MDITTENAIQLAQAVICQALSDVGVSARERTLPAQSKSEYRAAYLFLTSTSGSWAESRRLWADIADFDEHRLLRLGATLPAPVNVVPKVKKKQCEWDRDALAFLRSQGHLPGFPRRRKTELARILSEAGFRAPRGGMLTPDNIYSFVARNADEFC